MTATAIAAVLVAGSAAIAANIGILSAADSSAIGDLSATDELLPAAGAAPATPTAMVDTTVTPSTVTTMLPATGPQRYDIADTGSVWVATTTDGLALDRVVSEPAWTPMLSQGELRSLRVDFTNGDRTIVFTATLADDGGVVVDVTEPTTVVAAMPSNTPAQANSSAQSTAAGRTTPTTTGSPSGDDDYDENDDRSDDDHNENQNEDHGEYEGADDDD